MKRKPLFFLLLFTAILCCVAAYALTSEGKWTGIDETVIEKFAADAGRHAKEPLIRTDKGDVPLFVFLVAGILGGFITGYYCRILFHEKDKGGSQNSNV